MYHSISLKDFDILALQHIAINIDDLENLINLSLTCKDYYNGLLYLLKASNSILLNTFNRLNNKSFDVTINDSYYMISNLKYCFNTYTIPLPKNVNDITYDKIKNTEIIYNHFFYKHDNHSDVIVNNFYDKLFLMKYGDKVSNETLITKCNKYHFDFKKYIDIFEDDYYKYLVYDSNLTKYIELDTPIFNDVGKYSSNIVSYRYNYIVSHFELYSINIFLNNKKYIDVIQILEILEFNYTNRIGINDIVKKIKQTIDIDCYHNTTIFIKLIMLYIYVHYINCVVKNFQYFNNIKKQYYISCIGDIVESIKKYYSHEAIYKDGYDRCKPKYFFDYMRVGILDYCINLI